MQNQPHSNPHKTQRLQQPEDAAKNPSGQSPHNSSFTTRSTLTGAAAVISNLAWYFADKIDIPAHVAAGFAIVLTCAWIALVFSWLPAIARLVGFVATCAGMVIGVLYGHWYNTAIFPPSGRSYENLLDNGSFEDERVAWWNKNGKGENERITDANAPDGNWIICNAQSANASSFATVSIGAQRIPAVPGQVYRFAALIDMREARQVEYTFSFYDAAGKPIRVKDIPNTSGVIPSDKRWTPIGERLTAPPETASIYFNIAHGHDGVNALTPSRLCIDDIRIEQVSLP